MKISYLWLKEFVDFQRSPEELARLLRGLGFDVAAITRFGAEIQNVVTARVESREKHPNADRLSLCKVFDGKDRWDVVCGAPNVAAGQTVPLARVGARLPGGQKIEKAVLRGQESHGMICSERELGLGDNHAGILVLPDEVSLGEDIGDVLELGDAVLDVEVTPNRPDALSHWGIAREIAAALNGKLRLPDATFPKTKSVKNRVRVEEPSLCARYIGRVLTGVRVAPSPLRTRLRLERCGMRAINNIVDITNYVLLELGHPLHAFDLDKLAEGRVVVRRARSGESLACLDGVTRALNDSLVIADAEKPAALAGIIGGGHSALSDATTNILLESAHFNPTTVRRARKALNVSTESSYRFERGTDPVVADLASRRAAHLIHRLAGGTVTEEQDAGKGGLRPFFIVVQPDRINALLGTALKPAEMKASLARLGFQVSGASRWTVKPPVHRQDVREEPDVAEEVARSVGYDRVPARLQPAARMPDPLPSDWTLAHQARGILHGMGFYEARNSGLVSRQLWERFHPSGAAPVELANPLSTSGDILPPSLLPGLLTNVQTNLRHGSRDVRLYEIAPVFRRDNSRSDERGTRLAAADRSTENTSLAWVAGGSLYSGHWKHKPRPLDLWDAKAFAEAVLSEWRLPSVEWSPEGLPPYFHPREGQSLVLDGSAVGYVGRLHPRRAEEWELDPNTFLAELDLTRVASRAAAPVRYSALTRQPALYRDFSLVFPNSAAWSDVLRRLKRFPTVEGVELFDLFTDPSLPPDHRSLAFRIAFRHPERTLTDAEVGETQKAILSDLEREFKAQLRAAPPRPDA